MSWQTKPTDRLVLRFIKVYLSAPISQRVVRHAPNLSPSTITIGAATLGVTAGVVYGTGAAWLGAALAGVAQVFDGVDGQVSRLTDRQSKHGAFLDSVLDRYMDFSLMGGMLLYSLQVSAGETVLGVVVGVPGLVVLAVGAMVGSSQVSYSTARAQSLALAYERPESAGKGSRTTAIVLSGALTPLWPHAPVIGLLYLAVHPNLGVITALWRVMRQPEPVS